MSAMPTNRQPGFAELGYRGSGIRAFTSFCDGVVQQGGEKLWRCDRPSAGLQSAPDFCNIHDTKSTDLQAMLQNLPILKRELPIVPFLVSWHFPPLLMDPRRMVMPQFNDPVLITGPGNVTPMGPGDEPGHL